MSNDFPLRPTPSHCSDETINELFDGELAIHVAMSKAIDRVNELMRPAIPKLNAETIANGRVNEIEVYAGFDKNGHMTTKCVPRDPEHDALVQREKQARLEHMQRHIEYVRKEITEKRLDALDPDWRERFADYRAAELFYVKELNAERIRPRRLGNVVAGGHFEPEERADEWHNSDEDDDGFDSDLDGRGGERE
jgi:hypothetical protein